MRRGAGFSLPGRDSSRPLRAPHLALECAGYFVTGPYAELEILSTRAAWERKRREIRRVLYQCLGEMPVQPNPPRAKALAREERDGYTAEKLEIENGVDAVIPAYLVIPEGLTGRAPAILLLHWHSGMKEGQATTTCPR